MTSLRSVLYLLYLTLSLPLFGLPIVILGRFVSYYTLSRIARRWAWSNLWALRLICGLRYRVKGIERLTSSPTIIFSNHQSAWETMAFLYILPQPQAWVLKRELLQVPFFGWALARFQPIAIDRSAGRRAVKQLVDQGKAHLENEHWVMIFPEGTRVAPGVEAKHGIGGAMLAARANIKEVVPVVHNAGVFWARRSIKKYPGVIDVVIGEPVNIEGLRADDVREKVRCAMEADLSTLPWSRSGTSGSSMQARDSAS